MHIVIRNTEMWSRPQKGGVSMTVYSEETLTHYRFLVRLRDSGITNMYGASPYLSEAFGMDKYAARDILHSWVQTFSLPENEQPDDGREEGESDE